ncbi:MAG TPA: DUF933 domain-containing protein [Candidatus Aminicenantes bacterium]|nr:DUF933 domain-containing protein [Candidatus Aminicenantes bacterium]
MNITLFGYPKTGKTTLFNLLTGSKVAVRAYDDGKTEPNVKTCGIPDSRLDRIHGLYPEKKKISTQADFTDLGGISFGGVKDSQLLSRLRKADGLVHVVRGFKDASLPHPKNAIDVRRDILFMEEELVLADLASVEARLEKLDKDLKKAKNPEGEKEKEILARLRPELEQGKGIRHVRMAPAEEKLVRSFSFLSQKPLLHFINADEDDLPRLGRPGEAFGLNGEDRRILAFCGRIESELVELDDDERPVFMKDYGIEELCAPKFFRALGGFLDRISFFTVGKDETRAWMIPGGTTALQAAGAVHSDIEKGFIRAEVIPWDALLTHGSLHDAKEAGAIRLEGKEYAVKDGDVIYFRFAQ